jgi:hypothetical protein
VIADPYNRIQESNEENNTTRILLDRTIPPPQILPGDYNDDGIVNAADYTVWRNTLGGTVAILGTGADGDGNGKITAADFPVWKSHYGDSESAGGGSAHNIPEPRLASLLMLSAAIIAAARSWRRNRSRSSQRDGSGL